MEEILASIRKIIAEDPPGSKPAATAAPAAPTIQTMPRAPEPTRQPFSTESSFTRAFPTLDARPQSASDSAPLAAEASAPGRTEPQFTAPASSSTGALAVEPSTSKSNEQQGAAGAARADAGPSLGFGSRMAGRGDANRIEPVLSSPERRAAVDQQLADVFEDVSPVLPDFGSDNATSAPLPHEPSLSPIAPLAADVRDAAPVRAPSSFDAKPLVQSALDSLIGTPISSAPPQTEHRAGFTVSRHAFSADVLPDAPLAPAAPASTSASADADPFEFSLGPSPFARAAATAAASAEPAADTSASSAARDEAEQPAPRAALRDLASELADDLASDLANDLASDSAKDVSKDLANDLSAATDAAASAPVFDPAATVLAVVAAQADATLSTMQAASAAMASLSADLEALSAPEPAPSDAERPIETANADYTRPPVDTSAPDETVGAVVAAPAEAAATSEIVADDAAATSAEPVSDDVPAGELPATIHAPAESMAAEASVAAPVTSPAFAGLSAKLSEAAPAAPPVAQQPMAKGPHIADAHGEQTFQRSMEDTVADLLRPMLKSWISENMPRIVERALRKEIEEKMRAEHKSAAE